MMRAPLLKFEGRPVGKPRGRWFTLLVAGIGLFLAGLTFYIGYQAPNSVPGQGYYNIHLVFRNADNLNGHYDVRIDGLHAGQVLGTRVHNGDAVVDLQLLDQFKPLLSDSTAAIRLRSAVGIRYVDIRPGLHGSPIPEGGTIGLNDTNSPVDLDRVLRTFDPATRQGFHSILGELGAGVLDRGPDLSGTLAAMPQFLQTIGSVSNAITARTGAMAAFVRAADAAAVTFDPVREAIGTGFRPEAGAMQPFIDHRAAYAQTVNTAPSALSELHSGLPSVDALLGQIGGLAQQGLPTLQEMPVALRQTTALLRTARRPLGDAGRTLRFAQRAVSPTLALLGSASPELPRVNTMLAEIQPQVSYLAPRACEISNGVTGWADFIKWGDATNNMIRFTADLFDNGNNLLSSDQNTIPIISGLHAGRYFNSAYQGPCTGAGRYPGALADISPETGPQRETTLESMKGLTYTATDQPFMHNQDGGR